MASGPVYICDACHGLLADDGHEKVTMAAQPVQTGRDSWADGPFYYFHPHCFSRGTVRAYRTVFRDITIDQGLRTMGERT